MQRIVPRLANERGSTLVLVAMCTAAILGIGAVSVDLSMLLKARNDAQRAADAAALAGASAYLSADAIAARPVARDRALDYAARNYVGSRYIDTSGQMVITSGNHWVVQTREVKVEIAPSISRVRVTVSRPAVGTFFARLLGINAVTVSAFAAAEAVDAAASGCVMPFAMPDLWAEQAQDANGDRVEDGGEEWTFDPGTGDRYAPYNPGIIDPTQTGYGGDWRNANGEGITDDFGRLMVLKPQSPHDAAGPSNFNLWGFADDDAGNGGEGGVDDRIVNCDPRSVALGSDSDYVVVPGNRVHIQDPVQELLNRDPTAHWDNNTKTVIGSNQADWRNSARVVKVALYDPHQLATLGNRSPIVFNNIALFFIEGFVGGSGPHANVAGRFLYYASGNATGGTTGPLVKALRLVE